MKKDKEITKVLFVREVMPNSILAVFPDLKVGKDRVNCYSQIGQHSSTTIDYYEELKLANKQDYQWLYDELIALGYNLLVLNNDEPTKMVFTSEQVETRVFIIYKDGGVKIVDPVENNQATVMYLYAEELQELIKAIKAP